MVTKDASNAMFADLNEKYKVVTYKDLKGKSLIKLLKSVPQGWLRMELLNIIQKLVCALAIDFVGTPYSLFSLEVYLIRTQARNVFPGLLKLRPNAARFQRVEEEVEEEAEDEEQESDDEIVEVDLGGD